MLLEQGWHILGTACHQQVTEASAPVLPLTEVRLTSPTVLVIGTLVCWQFAMKFSTTLKCNYVASIWEWVLVTGSENKGISSDVRHLCQSFVTVMPGGKIHPAVDSLNVGVATGMLWFHSTVCSLCVSVSECALFYCFMSASIASVTSCYSHAVKRSLLLLTCAALIFRVVDVLNRKWSVVIHVTYLTHALRQINIVFFYILHMLWLCCVFICRYYIASSLVTVEEWRWVTVTIVICYYSTRQLYCTVRKNMNNERTFLCC